MNTMKIFLFQILKRTTLSQRRQKKKKMTSNKKMKKGDLKKVKENKNILKFYKIVKEEILQLKEKEKKNNRVRNGMKIS